MVIMDIEAMVARNQAEVNARLAVDGRCVMHNSNVTAPARYLLKLPIGNVLPLCVEHCRWWIEDAETNVDPTVQPVWVADLLGDQGVT